MFVSEALGVNEKGHLTIGGLDCVELKEQYGSPLYVMDEDLIRKTCRTYVNAMQKYYDGNGMVLYASKAFSCRYMCRIAKEEGHGAGCRLRRRTVHGNQSGFSNGKGLFSRE